MGQYLCLLPFDFASEDCRSSDTILECADHSELFQVISKLQATPVPRHFDTYMCRNHEGYGNTQKDRFGEPLMCVTVEQLLILALQEGVTRFVRNRAIWAYLRKLPRNTKVALYWA